MMAQNQKKPTQVELTREEEHGAQCTAQANRLRDTMEEQRAYHTFYHRPGRSKKEVSK